MFRILQVALFRWVQFHYLIIRLYQLRHRAGARRWLLISGVRHLTGLASAVFLVCVYPANIYMWIYDLELGDGSSLSAEGHVIRLLLQIFGILLSLWVWRQKRGLRKGV